MNLAAASSLLSGFLSCRPQTSPPVTTVRGSSRLSPPPSHLTPVPAALNYITPSLFIRVQCGTKSLNLNPKGAPPRIGTVGRGFLTGCHFIANFRYAVSIIESRESSYESHIHLRARGRRSDGAAPELTFLKFIFICSFLHSKDCIVVLAHFVCAPSALCVSSSVSNCLAFRLLRQIVYVGL